jgi:Tfp pilus assembly protein PilF/flagellar biogenesis protein FliO
MVINMLLIPTSNKKQLIILGILGIFFLGLAIYSNVLHAPFVYDDKGAITENEKINSLSESFTNLSNNRYVGFLSFAFNYSVGGVNVFGYHILNNLIHIINAILVYYFIILIFKTPKMRDSPLSKEFIAFSTSFIFIAHPLQTQAVTYITQRFTSLTTMFYLIAAVFYLKARLSSKSNESRQFFPNLKFLASYLISFISAILAMKTKEIALTLPFAIVMCELYFFGLDNKKLRRFAYLLPMLMTLLIIPLGTLKFKESLGDIAADVDYVSRETANISRTDYLISQFRVIITYLRLLFFPVNQNLDYDYPIYKTIFSFDIFLSLIVILFIIAIAIWTYKRAKLVSFGIAWFFLTLSVESGIIPIRDLINEHRVYLPSIGFFVTCVAAFDQTLLSRKIKIGLVVILVSILSLCTYSRNNIWRDPQILWEDVIAKAPNNSRAYNNLGVVFKERKEFKRAIEQFEKSLRANRNYTAVYYNLGDVQYRLGNYENAIVYLKQALTGKLDPQLHLDILNKLGRTYSAMGQTKKAIETFEEAIKLFPSSVVLLNNLGVQYVKNNQIDSAIKIFEKAIKIRGEKYLLDNLALAYTKKGDEEKSRLMQQKALELGNN